MQFITRAERTIYQLPLYLLWRKISVEASYKLFLQDEIFQSPYPL